MAPPGFYAPQKEDFSKKTSGLRKLSESFLRLSSVARAAR